MFPISLPPLRERREDIPLLMSYFLRHFSQRHGRRLAGFSTRLVNALLTYRFPGNIRELQNLIERGVICAGDGEVIDIVHLAEIGAPLMDSAIGLTPQGRLSAGEPRADAAPIAAPVADRVAGDPLLEGLQAFVSGRQRTLNQPLAEIELHLVRLAMERTGGNITAAAQMLGMSRAQVSYRLKGN